MISYVWNPIIDDGYQEISSEMDEKNTNTTQQTFMLWPKFLEWPLGSVGYIHPWCIHLLYTQN